MAISVLIQVHPQNKDFQVFAYLVVKYYLQNFAFLVSCNISVIAHLQRLK